MATWGEVTECQTAWTGSEFSGGYAALESGMLRLRGFVATADGRQLVSGELSGAPEDDEAIGLGLARQLRARGADAILAAAASQ